MSPIAIGRTPPSFVCLVAIRLAPKNACLAGSGMYPAMAALHSSVSEISSLRIVSVVYLPTSCLTCRGRRPSKPAAEPGELAFIRGHDIGLHYNGAVLVRNERCWDVFIGCCGRMFGSDSIGHHLFGGIFLSEVVRSLMATRMSPSAYSFYTSSEGVCSCPRGRSGAVRGGCFPRGGWVSSFGEGAVIQE